MMSSDTITKLPVDNPAAWTHMSVEEAFNIPRAEAEPLQLEVMRRRFAELRGKVDALLQKFASVHASLHNLFNSERHLVDRQTYRDRRSAALAEWQNLAS